MLDVALATMVAKAEQTSANMRRVEEHSSHVPETSHQWLRPRLVKTGIDWPWELVSQARKSAQPVFGGKVSGLRARFPDLFLIDGSRLDPIAHKLKILRNVTSSILPGGVTAVYDLFRGVTRQVLFDPDAAAAELLRAVPILSSLPNGFQ